MIFSWARTKFFSWHNGLVLIFFLLIALFLFKSIINIGFLSDDWHSLFIAAEGGPVWKFFVTNIIGTRGSSTYAPMWNVLFAGEYALFGLWPIGYHLVSIFLFAVGAFVLFLLAKRLFNDWLVGFIAGTLFLLLPNHVEAVAWISVQLHLLASLFYLLAMLVYERFSTTGSKKKYLLALFLAFLAMLTKETGITFIAGFILIDLYKKTPWRAVSKRLLTPLVIIGIYLWLRFYTTGILFGYYGQAHGGKSWLEMMRMMLEMSVNLFWSFPKRVLVTDRLDNHLVIVFFVALFLLLGCWRFLSQARKPAAWALAMYVIVSLPLLSVAYNALGNEGERYSYLPSFFAALFLAICWRQLLGRGRYVLLFSVVVLALVGSLVWPQFLRKQEQWQLAGQIVEKGFQSFAGLNLPAKSAVIFIGLPDNLQGAQLFRNATKEALFMRGITLAEGERVSMFSLLDQENFEQDLLTVQKSAESTIQLIPQAGVLLTGLPWEKTKYGQATLLGFKRQEQTGEKISFEVDQGAVATAKQAGWSVFLIYFSSGRFQALAL